jgi:hypothetical protein
MAGFFVLGVRDRQNWRLDRSGSETSMLTRCLIDLRW